MKRISLPLDVVAINFLSPDPDNQMTTLSQLVKTAVLYGDGASVLSFAGANCSMVHGLPNVDVAAQLAAMRVLVSYFAVDETIDIKVFNRRLAEVRQMEEDYAELSALEAPSFQQRLRLTDIRTQAATFANQEARHVRTMPDYPLQLEFLRAVDSGLIHQRAVTLNGSADDFMESFGESISDVLADDNAFPLMDSSAARFTRDSVPAANAGGSAIERAKATHLAAELFSELPTFSAASLDEIVDVRTELEVPLLRFRAKLLSLGGKVRRQPWDADFTGEVRNLVRSDIEPEVLELRERVAENSGLRSLARATASEAPACVALGIAAAGATTSLFGGPAAATLGAGTFAATMAAKAYDRWREERRDVEDNSLYFYMAAADSLEDLR